jgi:hypothetical protein
MLETSRSCRRTGCTRPAGASLSFRYATRQVWVRDPLAGEDLSRYDLCDLHADSLTVPRGWTRVDQRAPRPVTQLPEPVPAAAQEPPLLAQAVGATTGDRYARLLADLPRLSAVYSRPAPEVQVAAEPHPSVAGQLAIPVPEGEAGQGVVVSLEHYVGARRRED